MTAKRYPPIPKFVRCLGGRVPVKIVSKKEMAKYSDPGEELFGYFHESHRFILIARHLKPSERWRVLWHEISHIALWDSGIQNGLEGKLEEAICDAFASNTMRVLHG